MSKRTKISEKTPILTQECQFCARKAGKWGSRSQKAHKNADFVLGGPHRTARSGSAGLTEQHGAAQRGSQNSTEKLGGARNSTERPGAAGNNHPKRDKTAWDEAQRPEAQRNATAAQRNRNATAAQRNRNTTATQRNVTEA